MFPCVIFITLPLVCKPSAPYHTSLKKFSDKYLGITWAILWLFVVKQEEHPLTRKWRYNPILTPSGLEHYL